MATILAVDWGERRIGLAVSDPTGTLASGLETAQVHGREAALTAVAEAARAHGADRIVVGLPLLLSGEEGEAAREARAFAEALAGRVGLPVDTFDERLTSALAERRMREVRDAGAGGRRRGPRRTAARRERERGLVDREAAVALLESYLQRLRARGEV